jgi:hypothetical protein
MKIFALAVWLTALSAVAQTNFTTVTNLISGPFLRVVDGKVYDSRNNNQWITLPSMPNRTVSLMGRISTNMCLCVEEDAPVKYSPLVVGNVHPGTTVKRMVYRKIILINANPDDMMRHRIPSYRVTPVGYRVYNGQGYLAYDCGIPYEGSISVTTKIKMTNVVFSASQ